MKAIQWMSKKKYYTDVTHLTLDEETTVCGRRVHVNFTEVAFNGCLIDICQNCKKSLRMLSDETLENHNIDPKEVKGW